MSEKKFPTSRYSGPEESPGFLLWQVNMIWQRKQRNALAEIGLTHGQFVLLAALVWLEQYEQEIIQIQLATMTKVDPMLVSQILRKLESKGLIKRVQHSRDTRALALSSTESGRDLLKKALPIVEDTDEQFFAVLGKERKNFIASLLSLINE